MSSIVELFNKTLYRNSVSKILLNTNKIIKKLDENRGTIKVQDEIHRSCKFVQDILLSRWCLRICHICIDWDLTRNFPNFDFRTRLPGFSDCSLKSLQKINDACLYNVPTYKVTITNQKKRRGRLRMIIYSRIISLLIISSPKNIDKIKVSPM